MRKTKIICTLGPAVDSDELIREMILNGLDCARLNFSHGDHESQKVRIDRVKRVRTELNKPIPLLLDTKGPEIRLRDFKNGSVMLVKDQLFTLTDNMDELGDETHIGLTYPDLSLFVKVGTQILIDDGKIELKVVKIENKNLVCKVLNSGKVSNHKSINIPNVIVDMPYLSEVDKRDIIFGIEQCVDFIAASFVRRRQDVIDLKELLKKHDTSGKIKIIAKIENTEGVKNMEDIIAEADGVMVARGDLGVEVPFKMLPSLQKEMISKCYKAGKIVVTATQMLDSMQTNPRPTRAEVSDVANAIYDRTTAIMLSGESAAGQYPVESVKTMKDIAEYTEQDIDYEKRFYRHSLSLGNDFVSAISSSAVNASFQIDAKAIICVTQNGTTALKLSAYHPKCPIISVTVNEKACRQLNLAWNVYPIYAQAKTNTDELFLYAIEKALETGLVQKGDKVIITGGSAIGDTGTDMFKLHII